MKQYTGKYAKTAEQFRKDGLGEELIDKFILEEIAGEELHQDTSRDDEEALKLWKTFPEAAKKNWVGHAVCQNCFNTSFASGYHVRIDKYGDVIIQGKCAKCGAPIARLCD